MTQELPEGTVTVLFTDVVGSTELTNRLGDEPARRVLSACEDLVRQQVERHRGQEVKGMGDGLMIAFQSARRAVACAVDIQRSVADRNRREPDKGVDVSVGLHTGEVIREQADLFGATVNAAARVASQARGGEILVSSAVKAVLGAAPNIELDDRGEVLLKGFSEPWRLYGVHWEEEAGPAPPERTAFVGRDTERTQLRHVMDQAQRGRGALVLVGGEAGVGKTRLAEEIIAEARAKGLFTAAGRCYEMEGAPPYIPFVEIIEYAIRVAPPDNLLAALGDAAPEVAKLAPRIHRIVPDLGDPLDLPPEQARHLMFESVCDFFERGAGVQPMLLLLDDLHWADDSSCALLEHLANRLAQMPVLVIGTYRDVELDPETPLVRTLERLGRGRLFQRISLRRFGEEDVRSMLKSLGKKDPPKSLVDVIFSETEGVPYFVEEVFLHLLEEGRLFDSEGNWRSEIEVGEVEVPESVRLVISRRLERVSEETRRVLIQAAAMGRDFTYEFLQRLAEVDEDSLLDAIEEAERAHLIRSTEGTRPHFAFWHEQIRQTLLAGLSFPRRQRLHRRVAEAIEQLHADSLDDHVADLAYHLSLGGERDRAAEYFMRAAERAAAGHANKEALEYFQRALDLDPPADQREAILHKRAKLLLALFRGREAARDLEELLAMRRGSGDKTAEADILLDLGAAYWTVALDEPAVLFKSRDALQEAYDLARDLGDKARMARALLPTMWFTSFWPDYEPTRRANIEEAFALSQETDDEDLIIDARRARLDLLGGLDAEAEKEAEEIRAELEAKRSLVRLNNVLFFLMWFYYMRGKFELCVKRCDEGTELARRIGTEPVQYATIKGLALIDLGRFSEAWDSFQQEVADEAHPFGRAQRSLGIAAYYSELLAYEHAEKASRELIEEAREVGRPWIENLARVILGRALVSSGKVRGDTAEALRAELETLGARASSQVIGEALLEAGAADDALAQAEEGLASSKANGRFRDYVPALELKARALLALDRPEDALSVLDEALRLAKEMGYQRVLWRVYRTLATAHRDLGDAEEEARSHEEAGAVVRRIADTIPEGDLKDAFLSDPSVASALAAADTRRREGGTR